MWARNIIQTCMNVSPGEKVLLITDQPLAEVRERLTAEILACDPAELWQFVITTATRPLAAFPPPLHELARTCDVILNLRSDEGLSPTEQSVEVGARLEFLTSVQQGHARYAWGGNIDQHVLANELSADYNQIAALSHRLADRLRGRARVHITTALGTDLTLSIAGREPIPDTGLYHEPGQLGNLPAGEVFIAPVEDSAQGVLVVDKSFPGRLVETPVRITFEQGRAVSIEGGVEADDLRRIIAEGEAKEHGQWCRVIGELGIGTNPTARLTGNLMTDEKVMGTIHVALGNNTGFMGGGHNPAPIHVDGVVGQPTLVVDGETLIERGEYLV